VEGIDVYSLGQEQRADFRREFLGFVFQSFHLIAYLTLEENVMLPLATIRRPRRRKLAMAREALASVGLDGKGKRLPHQISGGKVNARPLPGPLSISRRSSWRTSPPETWTPKPPGRSWGSSRN
jgi:predicted ABC-type transport system involved in lysophospholipase L1 biosynthesis ATPase subunit